MNDRAVVRFDVLTDRPLATLLAQHGFIASGELVQISRGKGIGRPSIRVVHLTCTSDQVARAAVGVSAVIVADGTFNTAVHTC